MSGRRLVPLFAVVMLCVGCGRGTISVAPGGARGTDYSPSDRLRVMLPAPGPADVEAARIVAGRIVLVLQQTHADVALVPTDDPAAALAAAREAKAAYLIAPVIVEWVEGHAPPLTADRVTVRLDLRDVTSGETVSTVTFSNVSSLLAVTDTRPEALLDSTFDRAVTVLITNGSAAAPAPIELAASGAHTPARP